MKESLTVKASCESENSSLIGDPSLFFYLSPKERKKLHERKTVVACLHSHALYESVCALGGCFDAPKVFLVEEKVNLNVLRKHHLENDFHVHFLEEVHLFQHLHLRLHAR